MPASKYKHVYFNPSATSGKTRKKPWQAIIGRLPNGRKYDHCYETERQAAIGVDKILIKSGQEPVNILKRK